MFIRAASDVGGTFTDLVFYSVDPATGQCQAVRTAKVDTTPPNFEKGVMRSLESAVLKANTAKQITLPESSLRGRQERPSRQCVKHLLHILILLELVDEREHFCCLLFGQLGWHGANVLVLCGKWRDATSFEGFLQFAEVGEGAADDELDRYND